MQHWTYQEANKEHQFVTNIGFRNSSDNIGILSSLQGGLHIHIVHIFLPQHSKYAGTGTTLDIWFPNEPILHGISTIGHITAHGSARIYNISLESWGTFCFCAQSCNDIQSHKIYDFPIRYGIWVQFMCTLVYYFRCRLCSAASTHAAIVRTYTKSMSGSSPKLLSISIPLSYIFQFWRNYENQEVVFSSLIITVRCSKLTGGRVQKIYNISYTKHESLLLLIVGRIFWECSSHQTTNPKNSIACGS